MRFETMKNQRCEFHEIFNHGMQMLLIASCCSFVCLFVRPVAKSAAVWLALDRGALQEPPPVTPALAEESESPASYRRLGPLAQACRVQDSLAPGSSLIVEHSLNPPGSMA